MAQRYKIADFEKAIPGTGGLITAISAKVGCDWHTAKKHIDKSAKLTQMVEDEAHKVDDMAQSVVMTAIQKDKDIQTAKWWLERRKRDQFSTRNELTGANGGPMEHKITGFEQTLDKIYSDDE